MSVSPSKRPDARELVERREVVTVSAAVAARLAPLAAGRPIVIDHFASRRCGATIGDLRVRFGVDLAPTVTSEIGFIGDLPIHAETVVLEVLESGGASIEIAGPSFAPRPVIRLERPGLWLDFLHTHPHTRP